MSYMYRTVVILAPNLAMRRLGWARRKLPCAGILRGDSTFTLHKFGLPIKAFLVAKLHSPNVPSSATKTITGDALVYDANLDSAVSLLAVGRVREATNGCRVSFSSNFSEWGIRFSNADMSSQVGDHGLANSTVSIQ